MRWTHNRLNWAKYVKVNFLAFLAANSVVKSVSRILDSEFFSLARLASPKSMSWNINVHNYCLFQLWKASLPWCLSHFNSQKNSEHSLKFGKCFFSDFAKTKVFQKGLNFCSCFLWSYISGYPQLLEQILCVSVQRFVLVSLLQYLCTGKRFVHTYNGHTGMKWYWLSNIVISILSCHASFGGPSFPLIDCIFVNR